MSPNRTVAKPARRVRGMTLLELILALALSGLLLMAISMALHIHWTAFDVRRSRVEEAQLARAILRNIGDDIRSTLKFEPPDLSGMNLTSAVSGLTPTGDDSGGSGDTGGEQSGEGGTNGGGTSGGPSGGGSTSSPDGAAGAPQTPGDNQPGGSPAPSQGGVAEFGSPGESQGGASPSGNSAGGSGSSGGNSSGNSTGNSTGNSSDASSQNTGAEAGTEPVTESGPSVVVGLYGTATELQFDISRLPRIDQYQSLAAADGATAVPSDIKTIVYFLRSDDSAGTLDGSTMGSVQASTSGTGSGLMRAESDRAVSAWGEVNGSTESIYSAAKLLAEEVTSLQFQYFDGSDWLAEWNSDAQRGLPLAIEVLLAIGSPQSAPAAATTSLAAPLLDESNQRLYRMVVHLPVGGISASQTTETTESMDSTASSASTGSTGSTGSGGTGAGDGGTMP